MANLPQNEEEKKADTSEAIEPGNTSREPSAPVVTSHSSQKAVSHAGEMSMSGTHDVVAPDPQVNFSALDQYIYSLVQNMVDDVELYHAKVDQVKSRF